MVGAPRCPLIGRLFGPVRVVTAAASWVAVGVFLDTTVGIAADGLSAVSTGGGSSRMDGVELPELSSLEELETDSNVGLPRIVGVDEATVDNSAMLEDVELIVES